MWAMGRAWASPEQPPPGYNRWRCDHCGVGWVEKTKRYWSKCWICGRFGSLGRLGGGWSTPHTVRWEDVDGERAAEEVPDVRDSGVSDIDGLA